MRSPGSTAPEVGAYKHPAHHLRYKRRPLRLFVTNFVCAGVRSIAGTNKSRHRQSRSQFRGRVRSFFVGMRILRRRRGLASAEGRDSRRGAGRSQGEARAGPSWPEHDAAGHDARDAGLVKIRGGVLRAGGGGRGGAPSQKRGVCATTPPNVVVCAHERRHSPAWLLLLRTHSCTCAQWRARDGLSSDPQANYSKPGGKKDGGTSVETFLYGFPNKEARSGPRDQCESHVLDHRPSAAAAAQTWPDAVKLGRRRVAQRALGQMHSVGAAHWQAGARKAGWKEAGGGTVGNRQQDSQREVLKSVGYGSYEGYLCQWIGRMVRGKRLLRNLGGKASTPQYKQYHKPTLLSATSVHQCPGVITFAGWNYGLESCMNNEFRERMSGSSSMHCGQIMLEGNYVQWQSRSKAKYGSVAELCSKAGSRPMAESLKGGIWLGGRIMLEGRITPNGGVAQRRNMAQRPMSCTKATTLEGGQLCSKATTLEGGQLCSKAESCTKATTLEGGHAALKQSYARRRIPD
ncbi:hypothetical protein GGX14DRAFT_619342 [Mycena pura]|uniref:Uncharacterized protein n=1 Tax=Mycena pura TaxID=153505 RepID=A0AAD6UJE3_9AGAR|nr:hypothetical protein GGX14DRAFT_619342 [Mycena pura]